MRTEEAEECEGSALEQGHTPFVRKTLEVH
jgi:hypothetical protein